MSSLARLRDTLSPTSQQGVRGHWRPISACLDEDSGEYFNVGVMFQHEDKVEVRMLDTFDRIKCLFGARFDAGSISHLMMDIEETVRHSHQNLPNQLSSTIRLGRPLFASGTDAESIVDEFFKDVVTLGAVNIKRQNNNFRYRSTHKVRETVFDLMREKMPIEADNIILSKPYQLTLNNSKAVIDVDIPLLGTAAAGTIVSAWYKSPVVVENNLLRATSDLLLISNNSEYTHTFLSVLMPQQANGMSKAEFKKHQDASWRQLDRVRHSGIEVIESSSSGALADRTISWWAENAA